MAALPEFILRKFYSFNLPLRAKHAGQPARSPGSLPRYFNQPLRASMAIDAREVLGEINPFVYGQFIEHLEDCLYGGIWSPDGSQFNQPVIDLIQDLRPPVIRYPGGNFASGYHWEDGIGPRGARQARFDRAWNAPESNQVGTDEFMALCKLTGAAPFLVVNDGSGSPEEAARWVAYCNEPPAAPQGKRRAHNASRTPYGVRLWGVGNEVWGRWQIGHTGPEQYTERLLAFSRAMRQADPEIELVAVGDTIRSDEPQDPGRLWNQTVLRQAADQIDYLSFHLYQPDRDGWQEQYDLDELHHTVCAAPLDAERMIARLGAQIEQEAPGRAIKIAFDEWNIWLPPPEGASSMHKVEYTMRDGLYAASMLNAFHRQSKVLAIANLAQLVNILPLIYARRGKPIPHRSISLFDVPADAAPGFARRVGSAYLSFQRAGEYRCPAPGPVPGRHRDLQFRTLPAGNRAGQPPSPPANPGPDRAGWLSTPASGRSQPVTSRHAPGSQYVQRAGTCPQPSDRSNAHYRRPDRHNPAGFLSDGARLRFRINFFRPGCFFLIVPPNRVAQQHEDHQPQQRHPINSRPE
jgi:alpha-L-arabinofuranosidase